MTANGVSTLLMGFHCHQPVGNFDSVLRHGCKVCYGPLLEEMARFPGFRFSLHMSGYLLEWIEREEKGIFSNIRGLAGRGQMEMLTAGFFEPILAVIPPRDALGQISLLSDFIEDLSGTRPEGLWLTERIWEPSLIPLLREAGVSYTIVDDNHMTSSGQGGTDLTGRFITDTRGETMSLYPISQKLRYKTPFSPVNEAVDTVREAARGAGRTAIIFDDGEKFGMWPETWDWVYGKGWLRNFLAAILESGDIATATCREHFESSVPLGRVYLPPGSYIEMGEWTLPPDEAVTFHEIRGILGGLGRADDARRFVRGGLWPDFLVRYPESNNMHKKMIRISRRVASVKDPGVRRALYMGQCNDPYWHGIFGGLYLPVLRNGVKRALNEAERILDESSGVPGPVLEDINADGHPEAELRSADAVAVVTGLGAHLYELSDKDSLFDLLSTLARRPEQYHRAAGQPGKPDGQKPADIATIHDSARAMDVETRRLLLYDRYPRYAFVDHFLPPETGVSQMYEGSFQTLGEFAARSWRMELSRSAVTASIQGRLQAAEGPSVDIGIEKHMSLDKRLFTVRYTLTPVEGGPVTALFCSEINLHFPTGVRCAAQLDGRSFSLAEPLEAGTGTTLTVRDPVLAAPVIISSTELCEVWSYPVQTVSQSEQGFDVTYQASSFAMVRKMDFSKGKQVSLTLSLRF
ncbi:MAG: alpha-amylase/4-alpha-glucanotransferase domain-containing protein [bacterium]|nr:alpha-amylase/4-alpha-glucanotransferase domain-containing protein [bacterium]